MDAPNLIVQRILSRLDFLEFTERHHLCGYFYHFYPSETVTHALAPKYKNQWVHNSILSGELAYLNAEAKGSKLSGTILKGMHLIHDLYPDLGARFMSDMDLLISGDELNSWEALLEKSGYQKLSGESFLGNNFKQVWVKNVEAVEVNLELHSKLFFHTSREEWRTQKSIFSELTYLSPEDTLIHLCGHLAHQHTFLNLFWSFDLYLFLKKNQDHINWQLVYERAHLLQLKKSVTMCLWMLQRYFGVSLPSEVKKLFHLQRQSFWTSFLTLNFLLDPKSHPVSYFVLKHATKDRLRDALRYDAQWFFHYKVRTPKP